MDTEFEHLIPLTSLTNGAEISVARDVYAYTIQIVNVGFVGNPNQPDDWLLIDAGMPKSGSAIIAEAEHRFGSAARPRAIMLTHGHFDHVGALPELLEHWNVPVYAHKDELPYLTGELDYPPGNSSAGGGLVTMLSPFFPNHGLHLHAISPLPDDGRVPFTDDWQWLHTPGHTPGHVSFHRPFDGTLIAGDAFITVKQESMYHVVVQDVSFNGPPAYFTSDWHAAAESILRLASLRPQYALTGHGRPVHGEELRNGLAELTAQFSKRLKQTDSGRVQ